MDCTDIKASLSALIDDEVEPQTRHALERHLAECRACRDLLGEAEANDALVALDAGHAPPDRSVQELEQKVLARTVNAHRPRGRWTTWWGWLAAAASLLLAASIWVIDEQAEVSKVVSADEQIVPTTYRAQPHIRSWTLKGRPALAARAEATAARGPISREPLSSNDAETLESAALVLGLIERADDHTFADLETAREILEYDRTQLK